MTNCIFCKIIEGSLPCTKVYESESVIAFEDINPASPLHILVVPKIHHQDLNDNIDPSLLGELLSSVSQIAQREGLKSYRTVINTGSDAGQTVFHLHLHLLGGRKHAWPAG
jgi:histidine triad (HIT) family protein